ncbi:MAG: glycosyltransferase [Flavobacteriales bacterium]|nr:glycosyltransferase [Flavobacteriales bacterium]
MKVAFVHDWLVVHGGAEQVTRELVDLFDADVFALVDLLSADDRQAILHGKHARTSFVQHLPFARTHFRWYLPLFPSAIERLDLRGYDLVISASYAVAKGVRTHPGQVHVSYVHTPMRYAWVMEDAYLNDHGIGNGPKAWLVRRVLRYLRAWDLRVTTRVDRLVANSRNTAARIQHIHGRDAEVVYPPLDLARFAPGPGERTHYLAAARLVPYKRIDRIIAAFRALPDHKLVVLGDGPERERLQRVAPTNVAFRGHVDSDELVRSMQHARALIVAADEDFGLTPVEALACGTPAIALRRGGYQETITDGRTGLFFDEATPEAIRDTVLRFERDGVACSTQELRAAAEPFSRAHFRSAMTRIVNEAIAHARA